jgi:hypothetical protein
MHDDPTAADLREALAVTLEALAIPSPATAGDDETCTKILLERTANARVMLASILDTDRAGHPGVAWETAYLRAGLAEHPATGYQTWPEAMAGLDAAKAAAS